MGGGGGEEEGDGVSKICCILIKSTNAHCTITDFVIEIFIKFISKLLNRVCFRTNLLFEKKKLVVETCRKNTCNLFQRGHQTFVGAFVVT